MQTTHRTNKIHWQKERSTVTGQWHPAPADRVSWERRLAGRSIPRSEPLVPTGTLVTRASFFLIMSPSWRDPLRNRTVDLLLTMHGGFVL